MKRWAAMIGSGALLGCTPGLWAQCTPEWSSVGGGAEWFAGFRAGAVFDEDGPGALVPAVFLGGGFNEFAGQPLHYIVRWDGWKASDVGGGMGPAGQVEGVFDLLALDTAQGQIPRGTYASGAFNEAGGIPVHNLARWDGKAWHDVGGGLTSPWNVYGRGVCLFDDGGAGPALFVGGSFRYAGGVPAEGLARWDGQSWSAVGEGLKNCCQNTYASVYALAVFDDGRGPALYVGGNFYYAGGQAAYHIARWDGTSWEPVGGPGGGLNASVETLCVYDEDGPGPVKPALFAGGQFNYATGNPDPVWGMARWDGEDWSGVGAWHGGGAVKCATVWRSPDDDRENLYIGGFFNFLPDGTEIKGIARWNGQVWREVDYGVDGFGWSTVVSSLTGFDEDGEGPNPGGLYVGGMFFYAGTKGVQTNHIARWGCPLPPRCDADMDRNGTLDLFDFLAFVNLFNAGDAAADCDGSGELDLFDFLCFANAFNVGC